MKKKNDNLRSFANISKDEHIAISRKGGINSGKSRARRALICALTDYYYDKQFFSDGKFQDVDELIKTLSDKDDSELLDMAVEMGKDEAVKKKMSELDEALENLFDISDLFDD